MHVLMDACQHVLPSLCKPSYLIWKRSTAVLARSGLWSLCLTASLKFLLVLVLTSKNLLALLTSLLLRTCSSTVPFHRDLSARIHRPSAEGALQDAGVHRVLDQGRRGSGRPPRRHAPRQGRRQVPHLPGKPNQSPTRPTTPTALHAPRYVDHGRDAAGYGRWRLAEGANQEWTGGFVVAPRRAALLSRAGGWPAAIFYATRTSTRRGLSALPDSSPSARRLSHNFFARPARAAAAAAAGSLVRRGCLHAVDAPTEAGHRARSTAAAFLPVAK